MGVRTIRIGGVIQVYMDRLDELVRIWEASGKSINELAVLAEMTPGFIWKLRKGRVPNVSAVALARLAEALGTSINYLLGLSVDESGLPVAEPELAPVVARVNRLAAERRRQWARVAGEILDLMQPGETVPISDRAGRPEPIVDAETKDRLSRLDLQLAGLPAERQAEALLVLRALVAGQISIDERGNVRSAPAHQMGAEGASDETPH